MVDRFNLQRRRKCFVILKYSLATQCGTKDYAAIIYSVDLINLHFYDN